MAVRMAGRSAVSVKRLLALPGERLDRGAQGDRGLEARELDVTFRKLEGDWVVSTVSLVRTLAPITPLHSSI
jgi:hypothetical protein